MRADAPPLTSLCTVTDASAKEAVPRAEVRVRSLTYPLPLGAALPAHPGLPLPPTLCGR